MKTFFRVVACAILVFAVCSGFVFSQEVSKAYGEYIQSSFREFQDFSDKIWELNQFVAEQMAADRPDGLMKMNEQFDQLTAIPGTEDARKRLSEVYAEQMYDMQKFHTAKAKELFTDEQRKIMQERQFQFQESVMQRLDLLETAEDMTSASGFVVSSLTEGLPDFLELTPEQRDLITAQQKEYISKEIFLMSQARVDHPEKMKEMEMLIRKIKEAGSYEEIEELKEKLYDVQYEMYSHVAPQIMELARENRENFMRILTDSQKAKIKAVMDDMPDYMKNLFAAIDKQGGGLSILHNWRPGMGVPDTPNPEREAPRDRPQSERVFPQ